MLDELLRKRDYLPILKNEDGEAVTRDNWQKRREEMISLLEKYSYGKTPNIPVRVKGETYLT